MICLSKPVSWTRYGRKFFLGYLPLFVITASAILAQLPTATILGTVRDSSGAVVPGVTVTARQTETGQVRTAISGDTGSYRLAALPVGSYELRVEHPGFLTAVRSGLTLAVSQEAVMNFVLQVGAVEQEVSVTAEAPLVNTTSGSLGGLVNEQRVSELPLNGRNYVDLALMQTGVTQHIKTIGGTTTGFQGTWFSSSGAPLRSNNYLLDGAPLVNFIGAATSSVSGTTLGVDGIREFRLITNSFSAEYGMTMGSQMVIVSKGGTNDFHGSAFEYLRNSALDARNFFDFRTRTTPRRLPAFARNQFGAAAGGPIRKDTTFLYGVFEGLREHLGVTRVSQTIPSAARLDRGLVPQVSPVVKGIIGLYPEPNLPNNEFTFTAAQRTREDYGQVRIDRTLPAKTNLFGRYTVDDTEQVKPGDWPTHGNNPTSRSHFATLSGNYVFSPTLLNTSRFSYSRTVLGNVTTSDLRGPGISFVTGQEIGSITIPGITSIATDENSPNVLKQNIFTWSSDLFYTRGRHAIKLGTLINRYQRYLTFPNKVKGEVSFASLNAFLTAQPFRYQATTPGSIVDRTYVNSTLGFYVQDDLTVRSNFTLNLGLRYEFMTQPQESRGRGAALRDVVHDAKFTLGPPMRNMSLRNFSPRFGFAWDVRGDGHTAVRGGFGLLYDVGNFGGTFLVGVSATPPFSSISTVENPTVFSLPFVFPPESLGRSIRGPDYNMQQPHMLQYNLTVERQLPLDMGLTVSYAGSRGLNIMRILEGNATYPNILPDGSKFWRGNELRRNPNWDTFSFQNSSGNSWYNSLQLGLIKRLKNGLQFQSSYTWANLIDEGNSQVQADFGGRISLSDFRSADRGPAEFDVRHNWRFNAIYHLPGFSTAKVAGKLLNGWGISGIMSAQSGYPFNPYVTGNPSRSREQAGGVRDRPNTLPDAKHKEMSRGVSRGCGNLAAGTPVGTPQRWFDPCVFRVQPLGFLGNTARNVGRAPGEVNLDISLAKETALPRLGETGSLEFRAEFFNVLNRANFGVPNEPVYSATGNTLNPIASAGRINNTVTSSRQIQFALKVLF